MTVFTVTSIRLARVAELADAPHSKCGAERCVGSSPTSGTEFPLVRGCFLHYVRALCARIPLTLVPGRVWGPGGLWSCPGGGVAVLPPPRRSQLRRGRWWFGSLFFFSVPGGFPPDP